MKAVLAVVLICITSVVAQNIVCYYDSRAASYSTPTYPSNFSTTHCTHYIYDGIGVTSLGDVRVLSSYDTSSGFADFQALRKNANIKLFVQLGSERDGSKSLTNAIAGRCERLVNSVAIFLEQYNFDGVEIDRRTNDFDKGALARFINRLRARLYMMNKQLSVSVSAQLIDAYDITSLSLYADMINFHAYNFTGSFTRTANLAPLFSAGSATSAVSVNSTLTSWLTAGARRNKINLVVAAYGQTYVLTSEAQNGVGASAIGPGAAGPNTKRAGLLALYEFCTLASYTPATDANAATAYFFSGKNWVSIETEDTLVQKYTYVLDNGLAGVGIYTLDLDDATNACSKGAYRVAELAYQYFNGA
ncbi:chitotriosidase-1-like [Anopheles ziemanni]|uniref:chitotriosidase-1-like n=1 Tax=Anopheles coustani TaxID=139045 RepID=UPI00265AF462|nr:chitotriosidase-1-like [Anopheles coustani]XP_058177872.1 chitotriosidase-1-like [Anopheles ziemanni]